MSWVVSTYLYGAFDCMFLSCHVRVWECIHTLQLSECQETPCSKQAPYLKISDCNGTRTHNHLVRKRTLKHLAKLDIQATVECGYTLKLVRDMIKTYNQTWSNVHVVLRAADCHGKSASCQVWCPWVFCKWRYNVFNLSRDFTWSSQRRVILIYGWGLLAVCHHPDKSCDHSEDIMFSICHVTSRKHMFKWLDEFIGGCPIRWVTNLLCLMAIGLVQVEI